MAFHNYPYTDGHEINLDWFLEQFKPIAGELKKLTEALSNMTNAGETGPSYNIAFLGCPDTSTMDPVRGYGNCSVIYSGTSAIIIDFGNDENAVNLLSFLNMQGITTIRAVIISHYHQDHVRAGSLNALLASGLDLSMCKWILPHANIDWSRFTGTNYSSAESTVRSILAGRQIIQPDTEGYHIQIDDLALYFYNVTAGMYSDYYSYMYDENMTDTGHTNYNNFSMVCMIRSGLNICYTSDIEKPAEYNMCNVMTQADILQIPHHGLNCDVSMKALDGIRADIGILQSYGAAKERSCITAIRPYAARITKYGAVYTTYSGNDVIININGSNIRLSEGDIIAGNRLGVMIPSGSDLDDYTDAGSYYITNSAISRTCLNVPEVNTISIGAGELIVLGGTNNANGITQIYIPMYTAVRYICMRTRTGTGWNEWSIINLDLGLLVARSMAITNAIAGQNLVNLTITDQELNGLTSHVNDDGSVTISGTATASTIFQIGTVQQTAGTTYYIGGCPPGGSMSKYRLYFTGASGPEVDTGSGAVYTAPETLNKQLRFAVSNNVSIDATIYPVVLVK